MKVLNFGSLNIDYFFEVDHLVLPGETESSNNFFISCGGKGLNQSIALKRAGIDVFHAGKVGKNDNKILLNILKENNVDTTFIKKVNCNSGHAFIQVDKNGENNIVLNGGANKKIDKRMIDSVLSKFDEGDYLVIQNEISSLDYLISTAYKKKMKIVFNPSPINDSILNLPLKYIDIFFLNSLEAEILLGSKKDPLSSLIKKYPNSQFVITNGSKDSLYYDGKSIYSEKTMKIEAVDTTAAGDTFLGFFLASYLRGEKRPLLTANVASGLACLKKGSTVSIPILSEVQEKIKELY